MYCYVDLDIKQVNLRFYITRSYAVPNARHGWLVDLGDGPGSVFGHGVLKGASKISQETYGGSKSNWLKSFFPDLQWRGPDVVHERTERMKNPSVREAVAHHNGHHGTTRK